MKRTILILTVTLAAASCSRGLKITAVDSLTKVFPHDTVLAVCAGPIEVAAGENASVQFVAESDAFDIGDLRVASVSLPRSGMKLRTAGPVLLVSNNYYDYWDRDPQAYSPEDHLFPDPIVSDSTVFVPKGEKRSLWIDIDVPVGTKPGIYTVRTRIESSLGCKTCRFKVRVYPVEVTEQRLLVTNWMSVDTRYLNGGEPSFDGLYTEMYLKLIRMAGEYGNNCWTIESGGTPVKDAEGNITGWDFSGFDGEVGQLAANAPVAMFFGPHFGGRKEWVGHMNFKGMKPDDPKLKEWIYSYFPALQEHLKEKAFADGRRWIDCFAQYIADEPIDFCLEDWEKVASMIKDAAPEIRTIEAYRSSTLDRGLIDFPCPQLDEFAERELYRDITRDDNVWFYTCMFPRNSYANRFLDQQLIKTRLLHWINYRYNAVGYLHWGLNYWGGGHGTPYGDVANPASDWPAGDSHIIYPGCRKYYPSIRYCNMRDGIRDYELLRMVEDRDPEKAGEFVNRIILDYNSYDTDPADFRAVRHEILEYLSN